MKFFLWTSDKYTSIVADHAKLFNKFGGSETEVTVLGFNQPTVKYPDNFVFESMGSQDDFPGRVWSEPFRPFIEAVEEKYFCFTFDDMFPICQIDFDLWDEATQLVETDQASRVGFFFGSDKQYRTSEPFNENFNKLSQFAEYRSGLEPGVWNKEYFLKHMHHNMTPWDYEVKNMPAMTNDGAVMLCPRTKPIFGWVNMFRQGKFNDVMWNNYKTSPTGHFAWNTHQQLTPDVAKVVGSYMGRAL